MLAKDVFIYTHMYTYISTNSYTLINVQIYLYRYIYIRAYIYIHTYIQDKEVGFKGLIAPVAAIVLPLSHASMPPFIEDSQGGVSDTSDKKADTSDKKVADTSDKKEVSKGGKFVDPDAHMVTWTVLDLSSFAMVRIFESFYQAVFVSDSLCVFESLCL